RFGALRVALDGAAAQACDQLERTGQRRGGHAPAPVALADEVARDSPVRRGRQALLVGGAALDPRHLAGCAELAPAGAVAGVEDERGVRGPGAYALELEMPALRRRQLLVVLGMEPQAPASAEDTVVSLDQGCERVPGRRVEGLDRVRRRLRHDARPRARGPALRRGRPARAR